MTLWSGRVGGSLDPAVWPFCTRTTPSFHLRLRGEFSACTTAARAGLLSAAELTEAEERLSEIAGNPAAYLPADEDVHSSIERQLGDLGRKIQQAGRGTIRSLLIRLYVLDACGEARDGIDALALVVLSFAEAELDTLLPGYTHLQRGQPVTLGHHLLAWVEMLDRDRARFAAAAAAAAESPLGAGALAGSTLDLPAFPGQMRNSSTPSPTVTSRWTTSTPWRSSTRTCRESARRSSSGRRASSGSPRLPRTPRRGPR